MITSITSLFRALGLVVGLDDRVGSSFQPVANGSLHHLDMVEGSTPSLRATFLIDQSRYFTSLTASILTFAICGFVVYAISLILLLGVAKVMIHYE
jgi:hypothetical protein